MLLWQGFERRLKTPCIKFWIGIKEGTKDQFFILNVDKNGLGFHGGFQGVSWNSLQYNMLVHWADETNDSSTKCLKFQGFYLTNFNRLRALKTLYSHFVIS